MAALPAALDAGRPGIAALDVYDDEPLARRRMRSRRGERRAHAAPGLRERSGVRQVRTRVVENLLAWLDGKPLVRQATA